MIDEGLRELYQEVILDHGKNPRNHRHPEDANAHANGTNPLCGDRLTVFLKLGPDGRIEDAAFQGRGCAISQASASLMTEIVRGRTEAEADALFDKFHRLCTDDDYVPAPDDVDEEAMERLQVLSGVRAFPTRVKCATLAWHTLNAALHGSKEVSTE
ncbi:MAG: SUF system NifU family Fe-S cluster assembly protein [Alphaproteobacteria bacterium]